MNCNCNYTYQADHFDVSASTSDARTEAGALLGFFQGARLTKPKGNSAEVCPIDPSLHFLRQSACIRHACGEAIHWSRVGRKCSRSWQETCNRSSSSVDRSCPFQCTCLLGSIRLGTYFTTDGTYETLASPIPGPDLIIVKSTIVNAACCRVVAGAPP